MKHKAKSLLIVTVIVLIFGSVGYFLGGDGFTSGAVVNVAECHDDSDCNDDLLNTEDRCEYSGTEYSFCVNNFLEE
ncbi:MAG: hypothetical protein KKA62_02130 [Nanoarchaeota archaeon]|nr:hypothetical protein [Nanoarchaeota archaeon]MBU1644208.1 hypothetical protein [Nanoarchaeota archaeon]MBU1976733.1 hypothetical protein [Nanoarchaeota archaeon]